MKQRTKTKNLQNKKKTPKKKPHTKKPKKQIDSVFCVKLKLNIIAVLMLYDLNMSGSCDIHMNFTL